MLNCFRIGGRRCMLMKCFADFVGVAPRIVFYWINKHRMPVIPDGEGHFLIDVDIAMQWLKDKEYKHNRSQYEADPERYQILEPAQSVNAQIPAQIKHEVAGDPTDWKQDNVFNAFVDALQELEFRFNGHTIRRAGLLPRAHKTYNYLLKKGRSAENLLSDAEHLLSRPGANFSFLYQVLNEIKKKKIKR